MDEGLRFRFEATRVPVCRQVRLLGTQGGTHRLVCELKIFERADTSAQGLS